MAVLAAAGTRLSFAVDRSTAPLALAQLSFGRLSRARPPRKTSSQRRQTTPLGRPLSFQIVFDGHCDHSSTAAGDSQIPIARGGGWAPFRPAVSFFGGFRTPAPRVARRQAFGTGRHPKPFTGAEVRSWVAASAISA